MREAESGPIEQSRQDAGTESAPAPDLTDSERRAAEALFGDRLHLAESYVQHLCTTGITHGLLGPREVPRIWARHVLNCAAAAPELSPGATVADVGSGAGLPGLALAIARPDAEFILIEPMERRVDWLESVIADLGLTNAHVIRARAEEVADEVMADVVTARAVSALKNLIPMTSPLLAEDGELLLLKGRSAADEVTAAAKALKRARLGEPVIQLLGEDLLEEPTTVIRARRR